MAASYNDDLFRAQFPEFTDPVAYPEDLISAYWDMATNFISTADCPYAVLNNGSLAAALNYLAAHLMTLGQQALATQPPGSDQGGFTVSAKIGEIIVAKLPPPATSMWQWWLGQTPYGQALLAMLQILSVGGFAVGGLPERKSFRKGGGVFW